MTAVRGRMRKEGSETGAGTEGMWAGGDRRGGGRGFN